MIADLSHYNGDIDWSKAGAALDMAIFRASCGDYADKKYPEYTRACGIPYGAYHYCKAATAEEARREAAFFVECASAGEPLFWIADIEDKAQTQANTEAVCRAFLEEMKRLGCRRVGLYIGGKRYEWARPAFDLCDILWVPRWGKDDGNVPEDKYRPSGACDLWQYTSKGQVPGITGNVDLNLPVNGRDLAWFTGRTERSDEQMLNNLQLAAYCEQVFLAAWVYWYGTCGFNCTQALYNYKREQYPKHYKSERTAGYMADIAAGKVCADCVGLIKSFFWKGGDTQAAYKYLANGCPDVSADGMIALCEKRGAIATMPDIPGLVVHRTGHIGVYVGGGYVVEMRGFSYDCQRRKVSEGTWTEWGRLPARLLAYVDAPAAEPELIFGARVLKKGLKGADVKELQEKLLQLGYQLPAYGADCDFGGETQKAVAAFQNDHGLDSTGIFDTATLKALEMALLPAPPAEEPDTPENGGAPVYVLILEGTEDKLRLVQGAYGGKLCALDSIKVVEA